jgi:MFS family permease
MLKFIKQRLHPFAHSSFRLFFFAQSFSLIGSWSHELARSWLVLDIAGTATALGTLLLCTSLPGIFLALHGGAIADRTDARKLLIITKTLLAVAALVLFFIVEYSKIQLWVLFVFGVFEGLINSFDGPAYTAIFARTLPKEDFQQGIALQSTSFHVARMLGPAIAGLLMAYKGPSAVFLFDFISYIAVIYIISSIPLREKIIEGKTNVVHGLRQTLQSMKFFFNDPTKRYKQFQLFASIMIIIPLLNLVFRSFLKSKFDLSAEEFGYLFSFPALGAMVGAFYLTFAAPKKPIKNLIFGVPLIVISLLLVRNVHSPIMAAVLLGFCGFFSYLNVASITQSLHISTPDAYRGRLGSIITLGFTSIGPLMSYPIGIYTDHMGYEIAIRDCTIVFALISAYLAYENFIRRPKDIYG